MSSPRIPAPTVVTSYVVQPLLINASNRSDDALVANYVSTSDDPPAAVVLGAPALILSR